MANLFKIILRTGCCCNPGACQRFLNLTDNDIIKNFTVRPDITFKYYYLRWNIFLFTHCKSFQRFQAGHVCGDENDIVDGHHTGSVRISFGYMSSVDDANKFLEMLNHCFISHPIVRKMPQNLKMSPNTIKNVYSEETQSSYPSINLYNGLIPKDTFINNDANIHLKNRGTLTRILLYPIKSCGAFSIEQWPMTVKGLKYDREWMIVNPLGTAFTQKHNKKLCLVKPLINLETRVMVLTFKGN